MTFNEHEFPCKVLFSVSHGQSSPILSKESSLPIKVLSNARELSKQRSRKGPSPVNSLQQHSLASLPTVSFFIEIPHSAAHNTPSLVPIPSKHNTTTRSKTASLKPKALVTLASAHHSKEPTRVVDALSNRHHFNKGFGVISN